jgi:hypothetical protein
MKQDLKKVWKEDGWVFLTGEEVINRLLFAGKENTS